MPNDPRTKLIDLYAAHGVANLDESSAPFLAAFGEDREFLQDEGFQEWRQVVKEQMQLLEESAKRYQKKHGVPLGNPRPQVIECLRLLLMAASFFDKVEGHLYQRNIDVLKDLILARYGQKWPPHLAQHFAFLYPRIRDWNLFFFSYTNDGANLLNSAYKATIETAINEKGLKVECSDWSERNLVAPLFIHSLSRNNIQRGFYDRNDIEPGMRLKRILEESSRSFLFIQLVTKDALAFAKENWPFREYAAFKKANEELIAEHPEYKQILEERFQFALGGGPLDQIRPQGLDPPFDYQDWYDHIKTVHYESPPNDASLFQAALDEIAKAMGKFLRDTWIPAIEEPGDG